MGVYFFSISQYILLSTYFYGLIEIALAFASRRKVSYGSYLESAILMKQSSHEIIQLGLKASSLSLKPSDFSKVIPNRS